jgi:cystathionine gamma-lyase
MLSLLIVFVCLGGVAANWKIQTRAIHTGTESQHNGFSVVPPISVSAPYVQASPGQKPGTDDPNSYGKGYYYGRNSNPSRGAFERGLAATEGAKHCSAFSSGLAAAQAAIQLLKSGDHVVALNGLFGGTSGYFRQIAQPSSGIDFTFTGLDSVEQILAAVTPKTKKIFLETPSNPLLKTTDIRMVTAFAKKRGILVVVDGTFMSPYLQHPLELGADVVVHSVTKFIAGHSDVVMGAALTNSDELDARLREVQAYGGGVPSPFDCFLAQRGLKTLTVRMEAAMKNAQRVAEFLEAHPLIESVSYPGLKSYPQYALAKRQTEGAGAVMAVFIKGGLPVAGKFLSALKVFGLAVSLGSVESLASSPALMTHQDVPLQDRLKIGLTDSLIRLSIGIEHVDDLLEDLKQALAVAQTAYNASK